MKSQEQYLLNIVSSEDTAETLDFEHTEKGKAQAKAFMEACLKQPTCAYVELAYYNEDGRLVNRMIVEGKSYSKYIKAKFGF